MPTSKKNNSRTPRKVNKKPRSMQYKQQQQRQRNSLQHQQNKQALISVSKINAMPYLQLSLEEKMIYKLQHSTIDLRLNPNLREWRELQQRLEQ